MHKECILSLGFVIQNYKLQCGWYNRFTQPLMCYPIAGRYLLVQWLAGYCSYLVSHCIFLANSSMILSWPRLFIFVLFTNIFLT